MKTLVREILGREALVKSLYHKPQPASFRSNHAVEYTGLHSADLFSPNKTEGKQPSNKMLDTYFVILFYYTSCAGTQSKDHTCRTAKILLLIV